MPSQSQVGFSPCSLEFRDWGYRHASRRSFVARHLNLSIKAGEHVLLLGASGIGKSTILSAAAGLIGSNGISPDIDDSASADTAGSTGTIDDEGGTGEGSVVVGGIPAVEARGSVALMMQDPDSQAVLQRVGDNVAFGLENLGTQSRDIWPQVHAGMREVGLETLEMHRSTAHLSGGQMQRLALAGALVMNPGLLLLDEPTANLDPEGTQQVITALNNRLAQLNSTTIIVEHRAELWADVIDRVVVLGSSSGATRVVADGSPDEVFNNPSLNFDDLGVWVPRRYAAGKRQHASLRSLRPSASLQPGKVLLSARNLSVGRQGEAIARAINLNITSGEVTALVGMNGAGKSTLALTLAGLLPPVEGTVTASQELVDGTALQAKSATFLPPTQPRNKAAIPSSQNPQEWSSRQLARRISYVFQNPEHQFAKSTVLEEVMLGPLRAGVPQAQAEENGLKLLAQFNLERYAKANPYTLSGGEKRRLTVAAALASAARVIILDEPTFGQDRRTWAEIAKLIAQLCERGIAVVVVTHDTDLVEALGARVVRMGTEPSAQLQVSPLEERREVQRPASRSKVLATINPALRLIGAFLATIPLLVSLDVVSAGVSLALEVLVFAVLGIGPVRIIKSAWPVFIGAPGSALAVLLYGRAGGAVWFDWGMVLITQRSAELAGATALRVLAIGIPAIVLMLGIDMTDLADAFSQVLKLPDRFVYGGLAGMRLFGVIKEDWAALGAARRSRGLGDDSALASFFPQAFALLVLSIRRSTSLATAMEARGFGSELPRTHARRSQVHLRDYVFLGCCLFIPLAGLATAWLTGAIAFFGDHSIT